MWYGSDVNKYFESSILMVLLTIMFFVLNVVMYMIDHVGSVVLTNGSGVAPLAPFPSFHSMLMAGVTVMIVGTFYIDVRQTWHNFGHRVPTSVMFRLVVLVFASNLLGIVLYQGTIAYLQQRG